MKTWQVLLDGPKDLLERLAPYFQSEQARIISETGESDTAYWLASADFPETEDAREIHRLAERITHVINFFSCVCLGDERQVFPGNLRRGGSYVCLIDAARFWVIVPPSQQVAERLLSAAKEELVYRAMASFAIAPNDLQWLHKTLEAVQAKYGGGNVKAGAAKIEKQGWLPDTEQQRIKNTANSYKEAGLDARHVNPDKETPVKNPVTRFQARGLVQGLLLKLLGIR
jgi:hypothetical protein